MFKKILVPVDLTGKNEGSIGTAAHLAQQSGGEITLLHVIETLEIPWVEVEDFYKHLEGAATEKMGVMTEKLVESGLSVDPRVVYGKRAPEIVRHAEENGIDLIVIGSHPIDPDDPERSFMTISHQVALFSPTPVLIMR